MSLTEWNAFSGVFYRWAIIVPSCKCLQGGLFYDQKRNETN